MQQQPPVVHQHDYLSVDELRSLGGTLAGQSQVSLSIHTGSDLRGRQTRTLKEITSVYHAQRKAADSGALITPAAEWLLDNFLLIENAIQQVRRDLPMRFYQQLPSIDAGEKKSIPRMTALAGLYLQHSHDEVSVPRLTAMIEAYQQRLPCRIGELWAVPSLLRFVLIENLRVLVEQIQLRTRGREHANRTADLLFQAATPELRLACLQRESPTAMGDVYASQLIYRLRNASIPARECGIWLEEQLESRGSDSEEVLINEQTRLSAGAVRISDIVRSLRAVNDIDWTEWFTSVSYVDAMLSPHDDFDQIDFASQDQYRNAVESLSRQSGLDELAVIHHAIMLSQVPSMIPDVGHYLIGEGRVELEQRIGARLPLDERLVRRWVALGWLSVALPIALLTLSALLLAYLFLLASGAGVWQSALLAMLAALPASEGANGLFNSLVTRFKRPARLIGYEYADGVPAEARTLVVMPCLISSRDAIDDLIRNLEVHYLSNTGGELYYALLSDWVDSQHKISVEDEELLDYARAELNVLTERYAHTGSKRFYLLHRVRTFNEAQGVWMGWERKRGKLIELNKLLRGDPDTRFVDPTIPENVRFVMTLDADTRLTRDSVTRLVGKLAHPMNRAHIEPASRRVKRGHAILQPRVMPSLTTGEEASVFQHTFSQNRGLDPYVFTVSDVYQDLTGNGSFTGKGLYDVDAVSTVLHDRFDDNTILSHDLLEGSLARCALVTDIELVEDFPIRYEVDASRQHRWARGDWQLLPVIFGGDPGITPLARWKMLDNLRRSMVPIAWLLASLLGWFVLPMDYLMAWQTALVLSLFIAPTVGLVQGIVPDDALDLKVHTSAVLNGVGAVTAQALLRIVFIAHSALLMGDAIVRSLYRVYFSHRDLLEWRTAAQASTGASGTLLSYFYDMAGAVILGVAGLFLAAWSGTGVMLVAVPLCALWIISPLVAWRVSQSAETEERLQISAADQRSFRKIARRTWHFFDTFVTEEHHHLPPDNFQYDPVPVVANRTSPTNIGLYLLSVISARDFGWTGIQDTVSRLEKTLNAVETLEKHRGHLLNWYDTHSAAPLSPQYVSSVDSGNLAGHLIAVSATCRDWAEALYAYLQAGFDGIADVIAIVADELEKLPDDRRTIRPLRRRLAQRLEGMGKAAEALINEPEFAAVTISHLQTMADDIEKLCCEIDQEMGSPSSSVLAEWSRILAKTCGEVLADSRLEQDEVQSLRNRLVRLKDQARGLAFDMDFAFLMHADRRLLAIGYRVDSAQLDSSCYDLLASEARLTSLFAIAKGDLPTEHWFRLGRPVVPVGTRGALVSWSGSMFEYLMPPLVMQEQHGGILSQSNALAVDRQIQFGRHQKVPWGISESAFNGRDREMTYQYANFGVPSLGMKRGLGNDLVIAPYATLLAAQYRPGAAIANLKRLDRVGALGRYGYHDAIDFTASRLPVGTSHVVVRNFMAHHHGMSILAISNVIFQGRLRVRFHSDPVIEAAELLLQEKAPRNVPVLAINIHHGEALAGRDEAQSPSHRVISAPVAHDPAVSLLSNGHYSLLLCATGTGHATWNGLSVNRWIPDAIEDQAGHFLFIRDLQDHAWWSATAAPRQVSGETCEAVFSDSRAEFNKQVGSLRSTVEVIIASECDAEGRRITLFNDGEQERLLDITSYSEPVLSRAESDNAHPAFSKLFVRTTVSEDNTVIRAVRNRRRHDEPDMEVAHMVVGLRHDKQATEVETDRHRFIGRGRRLEIAAAFEKDAQLQGCSGYTLDPVFALRRTVRIPAGQQASLIFWTLAAPGRHELDAGIARLHHPESFDREAMHAWNRSQVQLRYVGMSTGEAIVFQVLASHLVFAKGILNPKVEFDAPASQSTLWSLGISGEHPILVLRIDDEADIEIVRKSLRAQEYFRARGLLIDLVIVNERLSSYVQELQTAIGALCENARLRGSSGDGSNHVFDLRQDLISELALSTLLSSARVVFHARNGKFSTQIDRAMRLLRTAKRKQQHTAVSIKAAPAGPSNASAGLPPDLQQLTCWNGYGGFDSSNEEYVVHLSAGNATPHPWINVLSNDSFGAHVSAEGTGYSWSRNSRDFQLTPWSNDPVVDRPGETLNIVDLDDHSVFSPFPVLAGSGQSSFEVRHGLGYSTFSSEASMVSMQLTQWVDVEDPIKFNQLTLTNSGTRTRRLRVYHYVEWVLGNDRSRTSPHIRARRSAVDEVLLASNQYHTEYADRTAFVASEQPWSSWTCKRHTAIGGGTVWRAPAMQSGLLLINNPGTPTRDPCAAITLDVTLAPGEQRNVRLMLGDAESEQAALALVARHRKRSFSESLEKIHRRWRELTQVLQIDTPDTAMNLMVNTWLPYQSVGCRLQARSAFYQASGAFGFRDQLQDTLAFLLHDPELARRHILKAASRQFREGDVQHWWLPNSGTGVRTRISDDVVWLVFGAAHYVKVTGDASILDESVYFLEGAELRPGEHDRMFRPVVTGEAATLYEHCVLALSVAMDRTGEHGLPLMLGGDWNDGMNRVGEQGKGESVWLGWFLASTLENFLVFGEQRADVARVQRWRAHRDALIFALESDAWEADHYLRAWYDDGTPLGSASSEECQIDSIAQSWAVISGLADPAHCDLAMDRVLDTLVDTEANIIRLFKPPFQHTVNEPGYIKGYPPGVRENGGQYTHAATWVVIALAKLGRGDDAYACFDRLNPVSHALNKESADIYRVEPYVVAADIYAGPGYAGRGGWTWYTGSAGWLYRSAVEAILGIRREGPFLYVSPTLPSHWPGYKARLRIAESVLDIVVEQQKESVRVSINGVRVNPETGWRLPVSTMQAMDG